MKIIYITVLCVLLLHPNAEGAKCESGWTPYKDDQCIKIFSTSLSFDDASKFCTTQGDEISKASLVMAKELKMQELLFNITLNIPENVWLGGKYAEDKARFQWEDGEPIIYENWKNGHPSNAHGLDACIELRPSNANQVANLAGQWVDAPCQKRNLVLCQKDLSWTWHDAISEITKMRKQIEYATIERDKLHTKLDTMTSMVIPIGSIYIEYFNQTGPEILWPSLKWQDISKNYEGLFFRAAGGASAGWGVKQAQCFPRITRMEYDQLSSGNFQTPQYLPETGWSPFVRTGFYQVDTSGSFWREGLRFYTQTCEVRPSNQAIKLWKRVG